MNDEEIARFRSILEARRRELHELSDGSADARATVELDQQSIGRLSRQDALQQQAMAKAQEARRAAEGRKIDAALTRIDEGEYGWCAQCGEAIALRRLEIDPAAVLCAPCAGGLKQ